MKHLILLGASGSIGRQTLDLLKADKESYRLTAFSLGLHVEKIPTILHDFPSVDTFCVQRRSDAEALQAQFPHHCVLYGDEGLLTLAKRNDYTLLVNALVGFVGFAPTLAAIQTGHDVALANKETLVCGGALITEALAKYGRRLYPIDSEHSAIQQCLAGNKKDRVARLWITCSGGPFQSYTDAQLRQVKVEQALAHPKWSMGAKITIDSANLMNKGFEVIEAHWLFDIPYEQIEVLIHPESIVHSMVEYVDHSIIAQMGVADMHIPISYALSGLERQALRDVACLDLIASGALHFSRPDTSRFPLLALAYTVGKRGGNLAAILNAANEVANFAFRQGKISFPRLAEIVQETVAAAPFEELNDVETLWRADAWGRRTAMKLMEGKTC